MTNKYRVIGVMSGSSLDGLDLALVDFEFDETWSYEVLQTSCISFDQSMKNQLSLISQASISVFAQVDIALGRFIGDAISLHFKDHLHSVDFVVSHGHTALHMPKEGYTLQIGNGSAIAAKVSKPVVCDLRSLDVALGGQGAPIVPMGERLILPSFEFFLNIGGICNISIHKNEAINAFDVCGGNTLLNYLSNQMNHDYDAKGNIARSGEVNSELLNEMNSWNYLDIRGPKSLSTEDLKSHFIPIFNRYANIPDCLRTTVEHIAMQIACVDYGENSNGLISGGGGSNDFLLERIRALSKIDWTLAESQLRDFKEAIIIGFLGVLRWRNEKNVMASVTGAQIDSVGGAIYYHSA